MSTTIGSVDEPTKITKRILKYGTSRLGEIRKTLGQNNLWKRMIKNVLATTITISLSLIQEPNSPFGKAAYLSSMMTVFAHPGRRVGQLTEALFLALAGVVVGSAWSFLAIYLSSLLIPSNPSAAYAVRGVFLAIALLTHGFLRSQTPRLWIFVLLLIVVCLINIATTSTQITPAFVTQLLYPTLMASAVILIVNIFLFPEFSSSFLGWTTIETLEEAATALTSAGRYFVHDAASPPNNDNIHIAALLPVAIDVTTENVDAAEEISLHLSLGDITSAKARLRSKLANCQAAQNESQFELALSVLSPQDMAQISKKIMKTLVTSVIAVIGACESRYALLGDMPLEAVETAGITKSRAYTRLLSGGVGNDELDLGMIKPTREIEYGDAELLRHLLNRIRTPYQKLESAMLQTVEVVNMCIAVAYDVSKLPSGARAPRGIIMEELDQYNASMQEALHNFDIETTSALEGGAVIQASKPDEHDIMPREELFLISSFLLNFRQAATQAAAMLEECRVLIVRRDRHHNRRRLYAPRIHWSKWLSGGGESGALPASGRKAARQGTSDSHTSEDVISARQNELDRPNGDDLERQGQMEPPTTVQRTLSNTDRPVNFRSSESLPFPLRIRGKIADVLQWTQDSEDLLYAFKLTFAAFIVVWPALVPTLNSWYSLNRGIWAALQLVFVFEVAIGTSFNSFFLRAIGTTLGSLWGWAAYEARYGNPAVCAAMLFIGLVPAVYVQLGSKYPKVGQVSIVSLAVVALSTELQTVPGSGTENFIKRWIAFLIGGTVALIVEITVLPVKARTRMVESLVTAINKIGRMEGCIAYGVEQGADIKGFPLEVLTSFENASGDATTAISAAETFLPFCSTEPRLKGSFSDFSMIYTEIIFVLHQIVDRMDSMLRLRTAYGSGPLEEFNDQIYPYRRNLAGSISLVLNSVQEALSTKIPLPQFLPSARLAHLRLINRVREVVRVGAEATDNQQGVSNIMRQHLLRRKYVSWNASSAAQGEVIDYIEELIDLTKLLVGANEFRSGILMRPTYSDYAAERRDLETASKSNARIKEGQDDVGLRKRRSPTETMDDRDKVPISLRRIQTRRFDAEIRRRATNESQ
ncbi:hypothetical protein MMC11_001411 [Xylographa trunciseda]|nr:hypothetical protein [Xylographa trunciseda]